MIVLLVTWKHTDDGTGRFGGEVRSRTGEMIDGIPVDRFRIIIHDKVGGPTGWEPMEIERLQKDARGADQWVRWSRESAQEIVAAAFRGLASHIDPSDLHESNGQVEINLGTCGPVK